MTASPLLPALLVLVAGHLLGAVAALTAPTAAGARAATAAGAILGGTGGLLLAAGVLVGELSLDVHLPDLLPLGGGVALRLDPLGAFFLGLAGAVAVPVAIYGLGYTREYEGRHSLGFLGAMLNLFLLSMSLVAVAGDVLTFAFAWESMALASYALVLTESDRPETVSAGHWYLAMTHVGLALLLAAFFLMAPATGALGFDELRGSAAGLSPAARSAVFALALLGFGSKAGLMPLHVWLPRAHPAAPSHVSALMSGVMIALGLYGFLRVGLDLLGPGPAWWGVVAIGLGVISALLGVLYALMEDDLKRLLAYSTVENVGLVWTGVGAALLFRGLGEPAAAALALAAGLYHALNHAAFKSLLFLGAGAVVQAAHSRDMNRLGGLVRGLPWTAACFLVGSVAIAGLPPLNGFVSEWLLFQSLLPGIGSPVALVPPVMTIAVGLVALTAGLAAAAFVKAFGITFLAIPRSAEAERAGEAPLSMRIGMGALALLCPVLALAAVPLLGLIVGVAGPLVGASIAPAAVGSGPFLHVSGIASMSPLLVAAGLAVAVAATWLGVRLAGAGRGLRIAETWGCGRVVQTPRMEYTSTAFAEPLRRVFAELYRPTQDLSIDVHPESRYFVQSIAYRSEVVPWFEQYLYAPVIAWVQAAAARVRSVQSGSVHAYLTYLVAALVLALVMLLVARQAG